MRMMIMMTIKLRKNNITRFNLYLRIEINSTYGRNKLCYMHVILLWLRDAQIFQKLQVLTQKSTRQQSDMKQTPYTANHGILCATHQNLVVQEVCVSSYRLKHSLVEPQTMTNAIFLQRFVHCCRSFESQYEIYCVSRTVSVFVITNTVTTVHLQ